MSQLLSDGTSNFNAGMNAWNSPESIAETQYYKGVNLTNRGSYLSRRPAFTEIQLTKALIKINKYLLFQPCH